MEISNIILNLIDAICSDASRKKEIIKRKKEFFLLRLVRFFDEEGVIAIPPKAGERNVVRFFHKEESDKGNLRFPLLSISCIIVALFSLWADRCDVL